SRIWASMRENSSPMPRSNAPTVVLRASRSRSMRTIASALPSVIRVTFDAIVASRLATSSRTASRSASEFESSSLPSSACRRSINVLGQIGGCHGGHRALELREARANFLPKLADRGHRGHERLFDALCKLGELGRNLGQLGIELPQFASDAVGALLARLLD